MKIRLPGVLLVAFAVLLSACGEPTFKEKPASEWGKRIGDRAAEAELLRGGEDAAKTLAWLLGSGDAGVRAGAARLLGGIGEKALDAAEDLVEALGDEDARVRSEAITALKKLGPATVPDLVDGLGEGGQTVRDGIFEVLESFGPKAKDAVPALEEIAAGGSDRLDAAHTLWRITRDTSVVLPLLREEWESGDADRAATAFDMLGPIGQGARSELFRVEEAMNDEAGGARVRARAALARWRIVGGADPSLAVLGKLLESKEARSRRIAAETLGEIGTPARPLLPVLQALLEDDDPGVRSAVETAIARIGAR